jgi:hypothetical protein
MLLDSVFRVDQGERFRRHHGRVANTQEIGSQFSTIIAVMCENWILLCEFALPKMQSLPLMEGWF